MDNNAGLVNADSIKQVLGTVTSFAVELEKFIAAAGVGGFNAEQVEQLTLLFGNLAGVAIRAVHDIAGKEITPESVLALAPVTTSLRDPLP